MAGNKKGPKPGTPRNLFAAATRRLQEAQKSYDAYFTVYADMIKEFDAQIVNYEAIKAPKTYVRSAEKSRYLMATHLKDALHLIEDQEIIALVNKTLQEHQGA